MKLNNLTVVKSNDIVEASYKLSLYEQRILLTCIAKINSKGSITIEDTFEISCKDILELNNLEGNDTAYKLLKKRTIFLT